MSDQEGTRFHLNQLLPDIIRFAFPKLKRLDIVAERADIENFFTEHEYDGGTYTLRVGNELKDAPMAVMAGAIAMELQQIEKETQMPIRYPTQRFFEKLSRRYASRVSRKEDLDLLSRGLGGNYAVFNSYITDHCGYIWEPRDGYSPRDFQTIASASVGLRWSLAFF